MRKIKLFIAMTLDGYIATLDDSLDWLMKINGEGDNGYGDFMKDIDTVIMGRTTYDWVMNEMNDDYPYKEQVSYVYTHQPRDNTAYIIYTAEAIHSLGERLKRTSGKDIWIVGGGQLICDFLEAGLVDEMTLTISPVLLGKGIRLFPEGGYESEWHLTKTETFNQFVNVHYRKK